MDNELDLYTGSLFYKNICFTFAFDKSELRLIPPEDKKSLIDWDWKFKEISPGQYVPADPIPVEDPYLTGECNETKHSIIFIPKQDSVLGLYNSVVRITLAAYIICRSDKDTINRITFVCPEINYIHPINKAFSLSLPVDELENKGIVTISTQDFDTTTTKGQLFLVDEKTITAFFSISRKISTTIHEPPLQLESSLIFEFEPTNDYYFIYRLWWIARNFIRFLCYRRNVFMPKIELSAPYKGGMYEAFATMHFIEQDGATESDALKKGRYIKQSYISGQEGKILSDIAQGNLYLRHLPDTFKSGRHFNAARFVMITAAFEWEFRRMYPNGVKKSAATIQAEETVYTSIQEHVDNSSGKQKAIYKFLRGLVKSDSLQSEIIQVSKDFSNIIDVFGKRLYRMNGLELIYSEMGQRLSKQRNNFAHGNLDKEFIGHSLLDLVFMEYVIYALQLKNYGVEDKIIQKSINDLFHLCIAL